MTGRAARPPLDERAVEGLLTGRDGDADPGLDQALALFRTLADGPAPPPTAALADLLDRGFEPTGVPMRRPTGRRRWAARTGAGLAAAAASVVVAGTAAALPPAMQDTVAGLVSFLTPFELPRPSSADDRAAADSDEDASKATTPRPSDIHLPPAATTGGPTAPMTGGPETSGADESSPTAPGEPSRHPASGAAEEQAEGSAEAQRRSDEEAAEAQRRSDEEAAEAQRRSDEEAAEAQRRSDEEAAEAQRRSDQEAAEG
ncbi:MAG: hypothetical protein ACLGI3_21100 [Actinomycetes bacterium]